MTGALGGKHVMTFNNRFGIERARLINRLGGRTTLLINLGGLIAAVAYAAEWKALNEAFSGRPFYPGPYYYMDDWTWMIAAFLNTVLPLIPVAAMLIIRNKYFSGAFLLFYIFVTGNAHWHIEAIKAGEKFTVGMIYNFHTLFFLVSLACLFLYLVGKTLKYLGDNLGPS